MAPRRTRPGRTLVVFFLAVAVLYGLVALAGSWKPALGLDLQGGTRITLEAQGDPTDENLEEARRIIDQRVNASGVTEAEVARSENFIITEIPGSTENRRELEELVKRQAQLRFRLVACSDADPTRCSGGGVPGLTPRAPVDLSGEETTGSPDDEQTRTADDDASPGDAESPTGTDSPSGTTSPTDGATDDPAAEEDGPRTVEDEIAWIRSPDPRSVALYNRYQCTEDGTLTEPAAKEGAEPKPVELVDDPDKPLVTCELREGQPIKYLLSRSVIEGTELDDAFAGIPQGEVEWAVNLELGNDPEKASPPGTSGASDDFETISRQLAGTGEQFAIVLDGVVISAPVMNDVITNGRSQITGDFTEESATALANSLKFGALPIAFDDDPTVEEIGPSLAGDQLSAGMMAGGLGLALVMLYCLLYYRLLGAVVVTSLFVAAAVTYAMVLLLSETAGFTLTLPGIAGLIVAVGITADSFVIYFERIRDEMRDGKSMRVAVETGWARARVTRFAANTVNLLSAAVLYIFATGAVKGFGFALGLTTLIDLAVLFWFTKPMVSWLAQFRLFNSGRKVSGLSPETLGIDPPVSRVATAGGRA